MATRSSTTVLPLLPRPRQNQYSVSNQYGSFNLSPARLDRASHSRELWQRPGQRTVNMRVSKTFGFGSETKKPSASPADQGSGPSHGGGGHGGPPGGGFGGPRGMGGIFGPSTTSRRYNLTLTATARNLFNTWNPGSPIGNLSSPMFGKTNSLAGGPFSSGTANRRLDFQAVFSF